MILSGIQLKFREMKLITNKKTLVFGTWWLNIKQLLIFLHMVSFPLSTYVYIFHVHVFMIFFSFCFHFRFTLLFSHGNAVDLGQMTSFFVGLGQRINCNIFSYDYSGYGMSTGKPTEKNLYADIDAAWHALRTRYGISPENIILYGQSIGTVPTVDLASR